MITKLCVSSPSFLPSNSLAPARVWKHRHHRIRNGRDAARSVQANDRILPNHVVRDDTKIPGPQQRTCALWILHRGVRLWARCELRASLFWGSSAPRDRVCRITAPRTRIFLHFLTHGLLGIRPASRIRVLGLGVTCCLHAHLHRQRVFCGCSGAYLALWIPPRGLLCNQHFVPPTCTSSYSTSPSPTPIGSNHHLPSPQDTTNSRVSLHR